MRNYNVVVSYVTIYHNVALPAVEYTQRFTLCILNLAVINQLHTISNVKTKCWYTTFSQWYPSYRNTK